MLASKFLVAPTSLQPYFRRRRAAFARRRRMGPKGEGRSWALGSGQAHGGGAIRIERILNLPRTQIIRNEMSIFLLRDSATILSRAPVKMSGADPCATGYQDCAPGRRAEPIRAHPKRSRPFPSPQSPPVAIMTPPNSCSRHKETLREVSRIILCRDSKCGLGGFQWANRVSKLTPWMQKWDIMP